MGMCPPLPYFSCMLCSCCAVVGVVPQRCGCGGPWPGGTGMASTLRSRATNPSALKRVSLYVLAGGMMPRRKLTPRGRGGGPGAWPTGVAPVVARLRRAASRRRPAAPLSGDSPLTSLRGCPPSSASSRGRFGEFVTGMRFPRCGEFAMPGDARRCCSATIWGGSAGIGCCCCCCCSSMEGITDGMVAGMTGFICVRGEMM